MSVDIQERLQGKLGAFTREGSVDERSVRIDIQERLCGTVRGVRTQSQCRRVRELGQEHQKRQGIRELWL